MNGKIRALHPDPSRKGINIDAQKYAAIRNAIMDVLAQGPVGFRNLVHRLEGDLEESFEGSIPWYVTTVKLDLEARGLIERVPDARPQQLRVRRQ